MTDVYSLSVAELPAPWREKITVVPSVDTLNRRVAVEFADLLEAKSQAGEMLTLILPVGPLQYRWFAEEVRRRKVSCRNLRTINMDEYLDENEQLISIEHPLSFRRYMQENFFELLPEENRPLPENIIFPNPAAPQEVTALVDEIGGADICWAGFGITGHLAFNDPPHMLGEPTDLDSFRNCKTRALDCSPMSTAQMAMGGTNGNLEIIPSRCVTIGMYEMLKSERFHLTFMRNWHAGLWRRGLLGPVSSEFPGSLLQDHPNLTVTMTELAAKPPMINTTQATGEE